MGRSSWRQYWASHARTWIARALAVIGLAACVAIGVLGIVYGGRQIAELGNALTGLAALFATAGALLQYESWKHKRRDERDAEVAGRALIAAVGWRDCLLGIGSVTFDEEFDPRDCSAGDIEFAEALQSRLWRHDLVKPFEDAWVHAEVYLPETVGEAMGVMWSLRNEIDRLLDTARFACGAYGASTPASHAAWTTLRGDDLRLRITNAYSSLRHQLAPLAMARR